MGARALTVGGNQRPRQSTHDSSVGGNTGAPPVRRKEPQTGSSARSSLGGSFPTPPVLLRKKDCFDNEVGSSTESQQSLLKNADSVIDRPPIMDGNMGKVSPRWQSFWSFAAQQWREIRSHVSTKSGDKPSHG